MCHGKAPGVVRWGNLVAHVEHAPVLRLDEGGVLVRSPAIEALVTAARAVLEESEILLESARVRALREAVDDVDEEATKLAGSLT